MAALIVLSGGLEKWAAYGLFGRPGKVRGAAVAASLAEAQFVLFLGVLALVLLFTPTGRLPSPRWRPVALLAAALPPITFLVMLLAPRELEAPFQGATNVLGIDGLGWLVPLAEVMLTVLMAIQLLSAASLLARFRHSGGVERQQLLWVVFGAGVMSPV